ncbi:MAG: hypothetical protein PUH70_13905 [Clostridiales bacterium]|nr:hypothetical protein [Clostridiales bacterium]MDY5348632.1 hypothetical protein [Candidatus Ventricola sp.]MDY5513196.1 hypothetical protein [Candidatus Ventricola sp.]
MEITQEQLDAVRREAYEEGYEEAIGRMRLAVRLAKLGEPDCRIVERTKLPPFIVHALLDQDQ